MNAGHASLREMFDSDDVLINHDSHGTLEAMEFGTNRPSMMERTAPIRPQPADVPFYAEEAEPSFMQSAPKESLGTRLAKPSKAKKEPKQQSDQTPSGNRRKVQLVRGLVVATVLVAGGGIMAAKQNAAFATAAKAFVGIDLAAINLPWERHVPAPVAAVPVAKSVQPVAIVPVVPVVAEPEVAADSDVQVTVIGAEEQAAPTVAQTAVVPQATMAPAPVAMVQAVQQAQPVAQPPVAHVAAIVPGAQVNPAPTPQPTNQVVNSKAPVATSATVASAAQVAAPQPTPAKEVAPKAALVASVAASVQEPIKMPPVQESPVPKAVKKLAAKPVMRQVKVAPNKIAKSAIEGRVAKSVPVVQEKKTVSKISPDLDEVIHPL